MECMRRFINRFLFNYKNSLAVISLKGYIVFQILIPLFQMMFFCTVAKHAYGGSDMTPWIIGNSLILCTSRAFFGVSLVFVSERSNGTLKSLVAGPSNMLVVILPRVCMFCIDGLVSVSVGFLAGILFFGFKISFSMLLPFFIVTVFCIVSSMGIGLLVGSFALLTRDIHMLTNLFNMLMIIFTGTNFHVDLLPKGIQWISYCIPMTRGIQIMRNIAGGASFASQSSLLMNELLIGILYFALGLMMFKYCEVTSRKKATLDLY